jgi:hypothetical protein
VSDRFNRVGVEDILAQRRDETTTAAANLRPFGQVAIDLSARDTREEFDPGQRFRGVDFGASLTRTAQTATARISYPPAAYTRLGVVGRASTFRYPRLAAKDADSTEAALEVAFTGAAVVTGTIEVGLLRHVTLAPGAPDFQGPTANIDLWSMLGEQTRFGGQYQRTTASALQPEYSLLMVDRYALAVQQMITRRFDVVLEAVHEEYDQLPYIPPDEPFTATLPFTDRGRRYVAQVGMRVGRMRVALDGTYVQQIGAEGYDSFRLGAAVSYGVFDVRNR